MCATLPNIRLHIHDKRQGKELRAEGLGLEANGARAAEIWFCGPTGLADALKRGLRNIRTLGGTPRFHQEAFEMR